MKKNVTEFLEQNFKVEDPSSRKPAVDVDFSDVKVSVKDADVASASLDGDEVVVTGNTPGKTVLHITATAGFLASTSKRRVEKTQTFDLPVEITAIEGESELLVEL